MQRIINSSSVRIPDKVLYDSRLSETEIIAYLKILSVMPDNVPSWRPFKIISMDTGVPEEKLHSYVKTLEQTGYLSISGDGILPNRYKDLFNIDNSPGFIYFCSGKNLAGDPVFKVGFTRDPKSRIKTLQQNRHGVTNLRFIKVYKLEGRFYALYLESHLKKLIAASGEKANFGAEYFSHLLLPVLEVELKTMMAQYGEGEEVTNEYQTLGCLL